MASIDLEKKINEAFVDDNFELAVDLYTQAIELDPKSADLYADRAQANIKLESFTGTPLPCLLTTLLFMVSEVVSIKPSIEMLTSSCVFLTKVCLFGSPILLIFLRILCLFCPATHIACSWIILGLSIGRLPRFLISEVSDLLLIFGYSCFFFGFMCLIQSAILGQDSSKLLILVVHYNLFELSCKLLKL